jgi:hypothetical protein
MSKQGNKQQVATVPISVSAIDMATVAALSASLGWTNEEIIHLAIREYAGRANPLWDAKGATPIKTIMKFANEVAKTPIDPDVDQHEM